MRIFYFLLAVCILFFSQDNVSAFTPAESKITVKLVGDDGNPVEGANVGITFQLPKGKNNYNSIEGFSDASGLFLGRSVSLDNAYYGAEKKGYYKSSGSFRFKEGIKSHRWQPWNPTVELLMRKIEKPVPMYERDTQMDDPRLNIPVSGKEIAFDLMKYDWLPPHGNGTTADFIVKLEKRFKDIRDYDARLTIKFTNKVDGIQLHKENRKYGSLFELPRFAPQDGYKNRLILRSKRAPGGRAVSDFQEDNNYFFRIRSEVVDGKLVRAMYGKIEGPIVFRRFVKKGAQLNFIYYLNPDYTRNMEMGRNLFK